MDKVKDSPENLIKAWNCILNGSRYLEVCRDNTIKKGRGINIFKFLDRSKSTPEHNCDYMYIDNMSSIWDLYIKEMPSSDKFIKTLTDDTMAIMVSVPEKNDLDTTVQNVKIFTMDTYKELIF